MNNVNKKSVGRESVLAHLDAIFVGPDRPFVGSAKPLIAPFVDINRPFVRFGLSAGFTLIELVVTLVIAAILLLVATPNLRTFVEGSRARAQVNDLVTDITYARSEAVRRGLQVGMCASNNGTTCLGGTSWQGGYLTFVDSNQDQIFDAGDTVIRYRQALSGGDLLTTSLLTGGTAPATLVFSGQGQVVTLSIPYTAFEFSLSNASRPTCAPHLIDVDKLGQVATHYTSTSACP